MNEFLPTNLSLEEKKRTGYIEGRPDLFETKVLRIKTVEINAAEAENKHYEILVTTRDPGSGNTLLPVMQELSHDTGVEMVAITDGRAQEIVQNNFQTEDITPKDSILAADMSFPNPDVILMDKSSGEIGLDTYALATYPEIPKVLVEDYYGTVKALLIELRKRGIKFPDMICVMDSGAKEIIIKDFPELADRIEITGQPAFDKFAREDTKQIARETKKRLGLKPTDKIVSFMAGFEELEKIKELASSLKDSAEEYYFVFRRHPRDNVSYEDYKKIFIDAGIKVLDTEKYTTIEIGAVSDVVLTTWSTEGLHGIYRRKPTVHIVDKKYRVADGLELPLVPVKLGASVGVEKISELSLILPGLLNPGSPLNIVLRTKMEEHYPNDGGNAKRVANIVRQYLPKDKK